MAHNIPNDTPPPKSNAPPLESIFWPMTITLSVLFFAIFQVFSWVIHLPPDPMHHNQLPGFVLLDYIQPTETDLRGPCPFLNTLANHGYINRNGADLRTDELEKALYRAGLDYYAAKRVHTIVKDGVPLAKEIDNGIYEFTLHDLRNATIQHPASLSRSDMPDLSSMQNEEEKVQALQSQSIPDVSRIYDLISMAHDNPWSKYKDGSQHTYLDATSIAHHHVNYAQNNSLSWSDIFAMNFECAILLEVIGRGGAVNARTLESVFIHERLPEDWKPAGERISSSQLFSRSTWCALTWMKVKYVDVALSRLQGLISRDEKGNAENDEL